MYIAIMSDDIFPTDFNIEHFRIIIIGCQGGIKHCIEWSDGSERNMNEVLGSLEYFKTILMMDQREKNKQIGEQQNKT